MDNYPGWIKSSALEAVILLAVVSRLVKGTLRAASWAGELGKGGATSSIGFITGIKGGGRLFFKKGEQDPLSDSKGRMCCQERKKLKDGMRKLGGEERGDPSFLRTCFLSEQTKKR